MSYTITYFLGTRHHVFPSKVWARRLSPHLFNISNLLIYLSCLLQLLDGSLLIRAEFQGFGKALSVSGLLEFWFRFFLNELRPASLTYIMYLKTDDNLRSTSINQARYTCLTPSCTFLVQGAMFSHRRYELEDYRLTWYIQYTSQSESALHDFQRVQLFQRRDNVRIW